MSGSGGIEGLREEAARLRAEMEAGAGGGEGRERLRDRLLDLGREIDRRIRELEEVRESLRPVAAAFRGRPRRYDHLGAAADRERGWSALVGGDFTAAIGALRSAFERDPGDPRTQALLGWAYAGAGDPARAAAVLADVAPPGAGGDPMAGVALGFLHLRNGRTREAVRALEAVAAEGEDATAVLYAHLYLGMAHAEAGALGESRRLLRRALELGPNLTEGYWELGRCHLREGRADLALEVWRAGGENRFSAWGERCRSGARRLEEGDLTDAP